ncbi:MAG: two-component system response regulator, partial [Clostridia bacterium]|nr:two-component system response regulator [Clostridia bacterium]
MMGTTFSKYVMNRKISHACYLLETTGWPVERIAQELG